MRCLSFISVILLTFVLVCPALSVELFRYRGAAGDGGTLEYVFETDQPACATTVTKEKIAEISADFMTTFYHVQIRALETQDLKTTPLPFWLVSFSDTIKGALRQLYFVVVLPNGQVVEPSVSRKL